VTGLDGIVREELARLARYEIPHPEGIRVRLDANESPFPLPPAVAADLGRRLGAVELHRYPDQEATALRQAVAGRLGVDGAQLVFGNGSDELITLVCAAFARPRGSTADGRARVAFPHPSFVVFRIAALAAGALPLEIPLDEGFQLGARAVDEGFARVRPNVVFFARPNNPTGTLFPRELVLSVAREFPDVLVISDEAYFDYCGDTLLGELAGLPNLAVMRTLSKIGMAGLRCGFLVAHPDVVTTLEKIRPPYNLSALDQVAARFLVEEHWELVRAGAAQVVAERERLAQALAGVPGVRVFPSRANFLCFRVGAAGDGQATATWKRLCERGVLIRSFDKPGPLAGCLRVTVGTRDENDAFLEAVEA
jgi:histidinol-phosphate aminotransferase